MFKSVLAALGVFLLGSVASAQAAPQSVTAVVGEPVAAWIASPNFNERAPGSRIDVLVLHSTCTASAAAAIRLFQNPASKVSSHYVVDKDGTVTQMVSETKRAWHAGVTNWQGRTDINSCSIGIEMQHRDQDPNDTWPDAQVQAVARLLANLRTRYRIPNDHVIFHSECAYPPGRKTDPQKFDRPRLLRLVAAMAIAPRSPDQP